MFQVRPQRFTLFVLASVPVSMLAATAIKLFVIFCRVIPGSATFAARLATVFKRTVEISLALEGMGGHTLRENYRHGHHQQKHS